MKIVLDTNVLISFYMFRGRVSAVLHALRDSADFYISTQILAEFEDVCREKFQLDADFIQARVQDIRYLTQVLVLTGPEVHLCRDPEDNHVLQLCREVNAALLLTGDKDLLVVGRFGNTQIVRPSELAEELGL